MIRYVDISEQSLQRIIPGTLNRLRQLVSLFEQYGFDIEIRDTDHTYDSLRFYPSGKNGNLNKFSELDAMLQRVIHETCCKCGTQGYVKQYPYDDKNSWGVTHCLCPDCHEHMLPKIKPIATSLKDFLGKNVTDGDIVVAITADNRPFWGLILNKPFANGWNGPNPKLGHYSLLHGWGNFPSSLGGQDALWWWPTVERNTILLILLHNTKENTNFGSKAIAISLSMIMHSCY